MKGELEISLGEIRVGTLTLLEGDRTIFSFREDYISKARKPVLSQAFINMPGELITEFRPTRMKLHPFFSNLLPEGHLRTYLAERGGVNPEREYMLLQLLGDDLPGAVIVKPDDNIRHAVERKGETETIKGKQSYRFSLAGVQLKFSAILESKGGLTIPAKGVGGDWIVKLPSQSFMHVPENEWSMLHLAGEAGILVPETNLVPLDKIKNLPDLGIFSGRNALAVKRFDRKENGSRIHIEDFAQVYGQYPKNKYGKVSYLNIANMLWTLTGEEGLIDFIRRLVFTIIIGNGDMHLKNWSFIYHDGITPTLSPAYDFVSTIPYVPSDTLALTLSHTKKFEEITVKHFKQLAEKAELPTFIVMQTMREAIDTVKSVWETHRLHYELPKEIIERINTHISRLRLSKCI
ncbi:MAG: type II toxin-antitoxin system HipA family toxin [Deltaproteobacteria bacterium]|nr:type II toxin-antitoxin system HipA family toxin [Deltaproteobacteria bacterium]